MNVIVPVVIAFVAVGLLFLLSAMVVSGRISEAERQAEDAEQARMLED